MRIAGTKSCSLVDGEGIRYVIFTQGCLHHCPGCQNPDTWDIHDGYEIDVSELAEDIKKHKYIDGVTLSGGEPFLQQDSCVELLKQIPEHLSVWIYTGFMYDDIKHTELAKMADYIVEGRFDKNYIIEGKYYGSSNQHVIDAKTGKAVM